MSSPCSQSSSFVHRNPHAFVHVAFGLNDGTPVASGPMATRGMVNAVGMQWMHCKKAVDTEGGEASVELASTGRAVSPPRGRREAQRTTPLEGTRKNGRNRTSTGTNGKQPHRIAFSLTCVRVCVCCRNLRVCSMAKKHAIDQKTADQKERERERALAHKIRLNAIPTNVLNRIFYFDVRNCHFGRCNKRSEQQCDERPANGGNKRRKKKSTDAISGSFASHTVVIIQNIGDLMSRFASGTFADPSFSYYSAQFWLIGPQKKDS